MMRRCRADERGFTLTELLLVIVVLGVLAFLAVLAVRPFQDAADKACHEVHGTIADVAGAADEAGLGDVRPDALDDEACVDIHLESVVAEENCCPVVTLDPEPATGRTLVAISGHRGSTGTASITGTGWVHRGTFNAGSGTTRRGVAVWTKIWQEGDDTTIEADWSGSGFSQSLMVQVFSRPLTSAAVAQNHSPGNATTLSLGSASASGGTALVVAGLVTREQSGGAGPGTVNWSGVPGIVAGASQGSSVNTSSGWVSVPSGSGPYEAVATWEHPRLATGFTMVMQP